MRRGVGQAQFAGDEFDGQLRPGLIQQIKSIKGFHNRQVQRGGHWQGLRMKGLTKIAQ